jgi:hypothetical protein
MAHQGVSVSADESHFAKRMHIMSNTENPPPRGIPNVSGVACHLSSTLLLLLHAIPPLRAALLEIAKYNNNDDTTAVLQELANLTRNIFHQDCNVEINPEPLYQALQESTSLDPHELGDAAKALRVLLHTLQQDESLLQPILKHYCMGGTLEQTLVGECKSYNKQQVCRIQKKKRPLPCPFSIPAEESTTSLQQALLNATIVPQTIVGVDWNQVSNYIQQEAQDCGDVLRCKEWTTTRTMSFASLPHYMLIHLQRAHYHDNAVQLWTHELHVPLQLHMEPYMTNDESLLVQDECCWTFQLVGSILHVSENDNVTHENHDEQEDGHYVTLVQSNSQDWYLFNDERVTLIPNEQQVVDLMSGRCPADCEFVEHGSSYCTIVLAYAKMCDCFDATNMTLMDDLRDSLQRTNTQTVESMVNWDEPHELVGRRLRIRWKSGKYYSGIISSYDPKSGKHCITYKDGDVRQYTLSKKTIEWIS